MTERTPVLIVGAGPVGLALAGDLGWRGVPCTLIEKTDGAIEHPKMDIVGVRTMEFCRRWGIADWVRDAPYPRRLSAGLHLRHRRSTATSSAASGFPAARTSSARRRARRSASACRRTCSTRSCSASCARFRHVTLRYHAELIDFEERADEVIATVRDLADRREHARSRPTIWSAPTAARAWCASAPASP